MIRRTLILMLAVGLALSASCLAEASSGERFRANLSATWDSLLDMAGEAGENISDWAEDSGVTDWVEEKAGEISAWADDIGLAEWAQGALEDVSDWYEASGLREWTRETADQFQAFIDENRPAVEAWLAQAGEEVRAAWDTLTDSTGHSREEIRQARETVVQSLKEAAGLAGD